MRNHRQLLLILQATPRLGIDQQQIRKTPMILNEESGQTRGSKAGVTVGCKLPILVMPSLG